MRRILLVVLGLAFVMSGTAWAQSSWYENMKIYGYMAPNFRMIDSGDDDVKNDLGLGMAYNRVVWTGDIEAGKIVKRVAWRVETDLKETSTHFLQYAYVEPKFSDLFSIRFGRDKKPFSLEQLYSTANQITADRHYGQGPMTSLGYAAYAYGLMANISHEVFKLNVGVYDGQGAKSNVSAQDPALDFGGRLIITPPSLKGLEIAANLMMTTIPEPGKDLGATRPPVYVDTDEDEYLSSSGMAFGADIQFDHDFGSMNLLAQAEFDMGDNWGENPEEEVAGEEWTWDEATWYKYQYMYLKARLKVTPDLGIYFGFSQYDPNTGSDKFAGSDIEVGENNETTQIIPGLIYYWTKNLRTMVEVQMVTQKVQEWDTQRDDWADDLEYTHFVLQQVFIWP